MKTRKQYRTAVAIAVLVPQSRALAHPVYRPQSPLTRDTATTIRANDLDFKKPKDIRLPTS